MFRFSLIIIVIPKACQEYDMPFVSHNRMFTNSQATKVPTAKVHLCVSWYEKWTLGPERLMDAVSERSASVKRGLSCVLEMLRPT